MPTPSERNALLFFSAVALFGAAVRFYRARGTDDVPSSAERSALEHQIAAVDSARDEQRTRRRRRAPRHARSQSSASSAASASTSVSSASSASLKLDLDTAPAESLVRLPRIGPTLAARIVADRDSLGPFGSLEGFQRVRGVGPSMARALDSYVTFSGTPRPSPVGARLSARRRTSRGEARDGRAPP